MKKTLNYWIRQCLLFLFLVGIINSAASQSFLSASGTKIVNASGTEVILKGVNVGNWVVQEGWMISADGNNPGTQGEMKKILYDKGFTDAQVESFYQGWRNNFITKPDIDFIASKGMNCIRFPMHYELFLTDAQRSVRNSVIKSKSNYANYKTQLAAWVASNTIATDYTVEGYRLIDNLLSWCAANNIYVILDMHAVPGSQGTDEHIADCISTPNDLWYSTVNQDVLNAIWKNISSRYKNNATVAMYDLINEPNNSPNATMKTVFQRLITTIRNNSDNHLIMIEGNGWGNNYTNITPDLFNPRTNLVYNIHRYDYDAWACPTDTNYRTSDKTQIQYLGNATDFRNKYSVPIFCGETGLRYYDWMKRNTQSLLSMKIGWVVWSYKWHTPMSYDYAFGNIPGITPAQINTAADMTQVLENIKFANMAINPNAGFWDALNATPPAPVSVTGVTVSPTSASVYSNATLQLTATVIPANASNKIISWSSSNTAVATVNASGLVSGISAGASVITVTTQDGNKNAISNITVTVPVQSPYSGTAIALPGIIEAENFDKGGEAIAYHDAETANQGNQYRTTEGVDIETCNEGGYDVGWTSTGEWLEYTVNVASSGSYNITVRMASTSTAGNLHIEFNGTDKTGVMNVPNTTGWQTWQNVTKTGVSLSAGQQVMRLYVDAAGFNLNNITVSSNNSVAVTGVSVSPTSASIAMGTTQQLTAAVLPTNATNKTVSWSSSNTAVATVNSSGLVTAVSAGTAIITVTTQDGNKTATSSITVSSVPVTGVSISPSSASMNIGTTQQLTATVAPSNATNKTVIWSSSNTSVATVNSTGLVTGVAYGNATITATTQNGSKTATCTLTVTNTQTPYGGTVWSIPGTIEAENFDNGGEGIAYHDAEIANQGGQYRTTEGVDIESCSEGGYDIGWTSAGDWMEYTVNVSAAGTYSIGASVAATVTSGTFHIEFNGINKTGTINVPNTNGNQTWQTITVSGISLSAGQQIMRIYIDAAWFNINKVTITSASNVVVTGVTLSSASLSLSIGATEQLTATIAPSNATNKTVSWTSSNTAIATVNSNGLITAVAAGNATISVTTQDGNKTASCAVTINPSIPSTFPGYYNILSAFSSKALDVKDVSTASGASIQQWDLSITGGGENQRWRLDDAGSGNYYIKVKSTQMCLALQSASTADGIKVIQETCNGSNTQKWSLTDVGSGIYKITNLFSNKSLDVTDVSNANGALIQVWTYNGGTNQQWRFAQVETTKSARVITDIAEAENMEINVYPNPAKDFIHITSQNEISSVEIYSISGKMVYKGIDTQIDVSGFSNGIYVVKCQSNEKTNFTKFVK